MKTQLTERVNFEFIRYANCWEDADILLEGLAPKAGEHILSIASAGDNSFSLLVSDPGLVVAVDVNAVQLHLVELKKACIKKLEREEVLAFLGFRESAGRKELFNRIKKELSPDARNYWENNTEVIEQGIIHQGKFEKYFQLFSGKILPWIHSKKKIEELFRPKPAAAQKEFYDRKWNSWRWRLLFRIFFSKQVMGKRGRDPEFLKEVNISVSDYIFKKAEQQLSSEQAQHNFILRYNLSAGFAELLPHYLREENFSKIKARIDVLVVYKGYAEDACVKYGKFDCMNLSNIFEYLDAATFTQVADGLAKGSNPGGRLAYWNLMVPRRISGLPASLLEYKKELSEILSKKDKGFFYNKFIVELVK